MKKNPLLDILDAMYRQAQMMYGGVVKGKWLYGGDSCPGCGKDITEMKWKKKKAVSLNTFIYRDHGVLIGYLLCGKCGHHIHSEAQKGGYTKLPIHDEIEKNLKADFVKHLGH